MTSETKRQTMSAKYMNCVLKMLCFVLIFAMFLSNGLQLEACSEDLEIHSKQIPLKSIGNRIIILVAFDANYTFSNFEFNLRQFAAALHCPFRNHYYSFYFGNESMQIICDLNTNLIDCVNSWILGNVTIAMRAFEASLCYYVVDNIYTLDKCFIAHEVLKLLLKQTTERAPYYLNSDPVIIKQTNTFSRKFVFLTNFVIKENINIVQFKKKIIVLLAINAKEYIQSQALYQFDIKNNRIWDGLILFNEKGIDRDFSQTNLDSTISIHNEYCTAFDITIPTFTEYPPPIEILVYIEPTSIASNRQTIVANFFRKIVRRLVADSCIGNRFIDKNNIIQIKFYSNLIIGNTTILRSIDMPWVGNQSFAAFEQLLVDDYINNMISMEKMMNRTDSQPIHTNCNHDPELDSIMKNFILNGTDPDDGTDVRKRILVFTNVDMRIDFAILTQHYHR